MVITLVLAVYFTKVRLSLNKITFTQSIKSNANLKGKNSNDFKTPDLF